MYGVVKEGNDGLNSQGKMRMPCPSLIHDPSGTDETKASKARPGGGCRGGGFGLLEKVDQGEGEWQKGCDNGEC